MAAVLLLASLCVVNAVPLKVNITHLTGDVVSKIVHFRHAVGVDTPIHWNESVAAFADSQGNRMCGQCSGSVPNVPAGDYGQNMAYRALYATANNSNDISSMMAWANSTSLGCSYCYAMGCPVGQPHQVFLTCNYFPQGNTPGLTYLGTSTDSPTDPTNARAIALLAQNYTGALATLQLANVTALAVESTANNVTATAVNLTTSNAMTPSVNLAAVNGSTLNASLSNGSPPLGSGTASVASPPPSLPTAAPSVSSSGSPPAGPAAASYGAANIGASGNAASSASHPSVPAAVGPSADSAGLATGSVTGLTSTNGAADASGVVDAMLKLTFPDSSGNGADRWKAKFHLKLVCTKDGQCQSPDDNGSADSSDASASQSSLDSGSGSPPSALSSTPPSAASLASTASAPADSSSAGGMPAVPSVSASNASGVSSSSVASPFSGTSAAASLAGSPSRIAMDSSAVPAVNSPIPQQQINIYVEPANSAAPVNGTSPLQASSVSAPSATGALPPVNVTAYAASPPSPSSLDSGSGPSPAPPPLPNAASLSSAASAPALASVANSNAPAPCPNEAPSSLNAVQAPAAAASTGPSPSNSVDSTVPAAQPQIVTDVTSAYMAAAGNRTSASAATGLPPPVSGAVSALGHPY
ncbi:hypothetical protein RI367_001601 [Sorochytrium milnesiophthora]